jgi:CRP/FNR family transcriptional regulator
VLQELAHVALCHEYPKNNILFYQGDPPESVFIVLRGRVRIAYTKDDGREIVLAIVPAGGVVGLVAAQDRLGQPGTAVTVAECQLAKIDAESFTSWMRRHEQVERLLLTSVSSRLRDAYGKIAEQALMGA